MPIDTKKSNAFRAGQYLEINDLLIAESFVKLLNEKEKKLLYEALTKESTIIEKSDTKRKFVREWNRTEQLDQEWDNPFTWWAWFGWNG